MGKHTIWMLLAGLVIAVLGACGEADEASDGRWSLETHEDTSRPPSAAPDAGPTDSGPIDSGSVDSGSVGSDATDSANQPDADTGRGGPPGCPQATALGWIDSTEESPATFIETKTLHTARLDASESFDEDGQIERYEWTLLSTPQGSSARIQPEGGSREATLFLDRAGSYEVELVVFDNDGLASCGERAVVTIEARPWRGIYMELFWHTPGDPNEHDGFGTDLDLHYLHPRGRWNDRRWDVFWRYPSANWGNLDDPDDVSLAMNDSDGLGPEVIIHEEPDDLMYRVGAYYYSAQTLGPSHATVRVYLDGTLDFEQTRELERTGAFWDVAAVDWASREVIPIDKMYEGMPEAP